VYRITAYNPVDKVWCDYEIRFDDDDGMWWDHVDGSTTREPVSGPVSLISKDVWHLHSKEVTPEQAMELTGLSHPMAAMDKLRELVLGM